MGGLTGAPSHPSEAPALAGEGQAAFHGTGNLHSLYQLSSHLQVCLARTHRCIASGESSGCSEDPGQFSLQALPYLSRVFTTYKHYKY